MEKSSKNFPLEMFMVVNDLSQKELAEYLGMSEANVSRIVRGVTKLTEKNVLKLRNNDKGWESDTLDYLEPKICTSASGSSSVNVAVNSNNRSNPSGEVALLRERVANLQKQLEEEKARSAQYWQMIQDLIKK